MKTRFILLCVALAATPLYARNRTHSMNEAHIRAAVSFWDASGRYTKADANLDGGPFAARQTVEGSTWLLGYYRLRGDGKVNPARDPQAQNDEQAAWDNWLERRMEFDYSRAEADAAVRNARAQNRQTPPGRVAPDPGPAPASLVEAAGNPPVFAEVVRPQRHTIKFPDQTLTYVDHVPMRRTFAYYRSHSGIMSGGERVRNMDASTLNALFQSANITAQKRRVFAAVSLLEGGFDSVNTYDTGFVSVGFIQFASLRAGGHSLGQVLLDMKTKTPAAFEKHFQRHGIDVTSEGLLVALDLDSEQPKVGPEANATIINDPRLIAIFQRAGRVSREFRVSQLRTADAMYWPGDDPIRVEVNGRILTGKVSDIFTSEAGLATLMDRKVNTGNFRELNNLLVTAAREYGFESLSEFRQIEWLLIDALEYRKDYTLDANLSQPRRTETVTSRSGTRRVGGSLRR